MIKLKEQRIMKVSMSSTGNARKKNKVLLNGMRPAITRILVLFVATILLTSTAACGNGSSRSNGSGLQDNDVTSGSGKETHTSLEDESSPEPPAPPTENDKPQKPSPSPANPSPENPSPTKPPPVKPSPDPTPPTDAPPPPDTPAMTYDEAFEICVGWLVNHKDLSSYSVRKEEEEFEDYPIPSTYSLFGEWYYKFLVSYEWNEDYTFGYAHWFLVNEKTGKLLSLFRTMSDDEGMTHTVELLDAWYNGDHYDFRPELLSAVGAVAVYDAWIAKNISSYKNFYYYPLNKDFYDIYTIFGDRYYHLHAEEDYIYWYNVLVHIETDELLFMLTGDGLYPETVIEPLAEWFDRMNA